MLGREGSHPPHFTRTPGCDIKEEVSGELQSHSSIYCPQNSRKVYTNIPRSICSITFRCWVALFLLGGRVTAQQISPALGASSLWAALSEVSALSRPRQPPRGCAGSLQKG